MSVTKRIKKINVVWKEKTHYVSEFQCPSCYTTFINTLNKSSKIKSFFCDKCGQILVIDE